MSDNDGSGGPARRPSAHGTAPDSSVQLPAPSVDITDHDAEPRVADANTVAEKWRRAAAKARLFHEMDGADGEDVPQKPVRRRTTMRDIGTVAFNLIGGRTNIRRWIDRVMKKGTGKDGDDQAAVQRRFLFEDDDRRYDLGASGDTGTVEDFNEVVDVDEARIETFVSQELVGHLTNSKTFNFSIFLIIIFNSVLIAMQTSDELTDTYSLPFSIIDQIVLTIFIFEIAIKWYYGFYAFWLGAWNIIDFVVIFILVFGNNFTYLASSRMLRLLRVLRAFRSVRSFSTSLESLSLVVDTILHSIPDMANVSLLLLVFMTVASVIGVTVFGDDYEQNFGNLLDALFVCFICVTEDGWVDIFKPMRDSKNPNIAFASSIYFLFLIMIGAFVFSNLIVAVVVTNLEIAMKDYTEEKNSERTQMFGSYITHTGAQSTSNDDEADCDEEEAARLKTVNVVSMDSLLSVENHAVAGQRPVQIPKRRRPAIRRVTRYATVLVALQENMAEYRAIRTDLARAAGVLAELDQLLRSQLTEDQRDPGARLMRAASMLPHSSMHGQLQDSAVNLPADILQNMDILRMVRASATSAAAQPMRRRVSGVLLGERLAGSTSSERRPQPLHRMNQY